MIFGHEIMRILFLTPLGFHVSFCLLEAADLKVLKVCFPLRNLEIHHENQYIYGIHVFVSFFPYRIWRLEIAKLKDMGIFSSDFLPMLEVAIFRMPKRGPIGECNWCCEVTPWKIHILEPQSLWRWMLQMIFRISSVGDFFRFQPFVFRGV